MQIGKLGAALATISTILAAIFGGIQLLQSRASPDISESVPATSNTAVAPNGVALSGTSLSGTSSTQITINNSDPYAFDFIKRQAEEYERQKHATKNESLEARLSETEESLRNWQFWYFKDLHPQSVEMLTDLAAHNYHQAERNYFNARWANHIASAETTKIYIEDILIRYGWATSNGNTLTATETGMRLLKKMNTTAPANPIHVKPSFDCRHAKEWYEQLICSDPELASLDVEMVSLFKQFQSQFGKSGRMLNPSQADWRNKIRNVCPTRDCLIRSYITRIDHLRIATTQ